MKEPTAAGEPPGDPTGIRARRIADVLRGSLVPLLWTSAAGFVAWAGALLLYDAAGNMGPLAAVGGWPFIGLLYLFFILVLAPVTYAVATWRLGVRGALIAFAGVELIGPTLWSLSPWSTVDQEARFGYYDETRGWVGFGLLLFGFGWFLIVPPITYLARAAWRRWERSRR